MTQAWYMVSHPAGLPKPSDFELRTVELPTLSEGEVRVRSRWISVEPAMLALMKGNEAGNIAQPIRIGEMIRSPGLGEVIESRSPDYAVGDIVKHRQGWATESICKANEVVNIPSDGPVEQLYLGHMGVIGMAAYVGLLDVASPRAGQTLFVSSAAGAVGSAAVQIAKIKGLRVIGSAGGPAKCAMVRSLGADDVIDYKAPGSLEEKLAAAAPEGLDLYFDNVGGDHLDAALACANQHAQFIMCGMVGEYGATTPTQLSNLTRILVQRIQLYGYIAGDYAHRAEDFRREVAGWIASGQMKSVETVHHGIETLPQAFLHLFTGASAGKILVRL
ncbi:MAG: zinc-binding alcohol dehydrogenase [Bradyrhizobium sp.]|nr:zinc-binding alcohol dehydrogenase [Bradyrhizobium sp.]